MAMAMADGMENGAITRRRRRWVLLIFVFCIRMAFVALSIACLPFFIVFSAGLAFLVMAWGFLFFLPAFACIFLISRLVRRLSHSTSLLGFMKDKNNSKPLPSPLISKSIIVRETHGISSSKEEEEEEEAQLLTIALNDEATEEQKDRDDQLENSSSPAVVKTSEIISSIGDGADDDDDDDGDEADGDGDTDHVLGSSNDDPFMQILGSTEAHSSSSSSSRCSTENEGDLTEFSSTNPFPNSIPLLQEEQSSNDSINVLGSSNDTLNVLESPNDSINVLGSSNATINVLGSSNDSSNVLANDTINVAGSSNDTINVLESSNDSSNVLANETINVLGSSNESSNVWVTDTTSVLRSSNDTINVLRSSNDSSNVVANDTINVLGSSKDSSNVLVNDTISVLGISNDAITVLGSSNDSSNVVANDTINVLGSSKDSRNVSVNDTISVLGSSNDTITVLRSSNDSSNVVGNDTINVLGRSKDSSNVLVNDTISVLESSNDTINVWGSSNDCSNVVANDTINVLGSSNDCSNVLVNDTISVLGSSNDPVLMKNSACTEDYTENECDLSANIPNSDCYLEEENTESGNDLGKMPDSTQDQSNPSMSQSSGAEIVGNKDMQTTCNTPDSVIKNESVKVDADDAIRMMPDSPFKLETSSSLMSCFMTERVSDEDELPPGIANSRVNLIKKNNDSEAILAKTESGLSEESSDSTCALSKPSIHQNVAANCDVDRSQDNNERQSSKPDYENIASDMHKYYNTLWNNDDDVNQKSKQKEENDESFTNAETSFNDVIDSPFYSAKGSLCSSEIKYSVQDKESVLSSSASVSASVGKKHHKFFPNRLRRGKTYREGTFPDSVKLVSDQFARKSSSDEQQEQQKEEQHIKSLHNVKSTSVVLNAFQRKYANLKQAWIRAFPLRQHTGSGSGTP